MRVLNISLDRKIFEQDSRTKYRILSYADLVDKYLVIATSPDKKEINISPRVVIYGSGGNNKIVSFFNIFFLAKSIIEKERIDVISVQDQYFLGFLSWLIARIKNIPLEIQVHGFEKFGGVRKFVAKFILPRADSIRTVSERLKKRLVSEFSVDKKKVTVVPIYIEVNPPATQASERAGSRKSTRLQHKLASGQEVERNDGKIIFFSAGRMVPVKNFNMQIEAMAEVVKKYPNAELWIAGDGEELENIKLQITNYKLQNCVKLLGWQSDLNIYYQEADVFMLTSFAEGWPLVIVEAAGYGLPIIMTDVGSAGELIISEQSGLIVPIDDETALAKAMIRLIEDQKLRERLGEAARVKIENQPKQADILQLYKESWEKAIEERKNDAGSNRFLWFLIMILIVCASMPSIVKIYQIKELYLSGQTRTEALNAVKSLHDNLGLGATDLSLYKIDRHNGANDFYFHYNYRKSGSKRYIEDFKVGVNGAKTVINKL